MTISIEDRKVFAALAVAIADALEHPECPRELADALLENLTPLEDLLSGSATAYQTCAATLRSLAAMYESSHTETRPEAESFAVASSERNGRRHTREAEALAIH